MVQPLPETGKPPQFSGAVGEYQISAQTERSSVETGSAMTLSVRISGRGNMQTVTAPKLPAMTGVVVKGPILSEDSTSTSQVYTYTLIPAHTGTLRIPSIAYTYFDPSRAVYATTQTAPIPFSVRPKPNDMMEIETEEGSWKFWVILLLAIVLVGVLIGGFLWYRVGFTKAPTNTAMEADTPSGSVQTQGNEAQPETPVSQAHAALAKLRHNETIDEETPFANALAQTLYQYLEDTLALSQRSIDAAREACAQAQVSEGTLEALVDLLTKCDYHRFAPVPLSNDEQKSLITRAEAVINDIENLQDTNTK